MKPPERVDSITFTGAEAADLLLVLERAFDPDLDSADVRGTAIAKVRRALDRAVRLERHRAQKP